MPVNPADSPILGTLYGSDAMRAVFDETAYFQRMLDVEAALARVQGRMGIIPADAAEAIIAAADVENLRTEDLAASARNVGYPVVGLVAGLSKAAGAAGGWTHWGATTQDIMDTATVLQVRAGPRPDRDRAAGDPDARWPPRRGRHRAHGDGRPHPSATGAADHLRPEMRHLGYAVPRPSRAPAGSFAPRVEIVEFAGAAGTLASLGDQGIAVMEALAAELGPARAARAVACLPRRAGRDGRLPRPGLRQPGENRHRHHPAGADRGG